MAISLECLNLLIPVARIGRVWPGGFAAFWHAHGRQPRLWHDGRLLRDGALHLEQLQLQLAWWQQRGIGLAAGPAHSQDLCVVDSQRGLISSPCDWLELDMGHARARLRR